MNLSTHFTLAEFTVSQEGSRHGLDNTPPPYLMANLEHTALGLEGVRVLLGAPIIISSGYRSPQVNALVRGSATSQHMQGLAADFIAPGFGSPLQIARAILASKLAFDQMIMEGTWTHISFTATPRRQVMTAHFVDGEPHYTPGLA